MKNLSDMEKELRSGPRSREIMDAANSAEAKHLAEKLDKSAVEAAIRSGDGEKIRAIFSQVLASPEGRALAQRLDKTMKGK